MEKKDVGLERLTGLFEDFGRHHGREALLALIGKLHQNVQAGERVSAGELTEVREAFPPREEFQQTVFGMLAKRGVLETADDGTLIVNDALLFKQRPVDYRKGSRRLKALSDHWARTPFEFFGNAFAGKRVILKKDYAQGEREGKPLFYMPESKTEALDIEKIRAADFHFGLWQLPQATRSGEGGGQRLPQPGAIDDLGYVETAVAAVLYHPKYGNAERSGPGRRLRVADADGAKGFSGEWLANQGFGFRDAGEGGGVLRDRPVEGLQKYAPRLFAKGLLTTADFRASETTRAMEQLVRVSSNGQVRHEGVRYYLGREYVHRRLRLEPLAGGLMGIVELDDSDQAKLVGTFRTAARGDTQLIERRTATGVFWDAGAKVSRPEPFDEKQFRQRQPGETDQEFQRRLEDLEDFQLFLRLDNDLRQQTQMRLGDVDPVSLARLRSSPDFVRKQLPTVEKTALVAGVRGLEAVAGLLDIEGAAPELMRILPNVTEDERQRFLDSLRMALQAREAALQLLEDGQHNGELTEAQERQMRFELDRRVTTLLAAADDATRSKKLVEQRSLETVMQDMSRQSTEVILFTKIFKDAFKGKEGQADFAEMRGVHLERRMPQEFTNKERQEMLAIFDQNWSDQDQLAAKAFRKMLEQKSRAENTDSHFYVLKKDQAFLAFLRLDTYEEREPGALYFGSMNVNPHFRGSAIGEAFMRQTLHQEAADHTLYAHVVPDAVVGAKYVEDGFVITGVDEIVVDGKKTVELAIRRDDRRADRYLAGREMTLQQLQQGIPGVRVERFQYPQQKEEFLTAIREAANRGEVATRYFVDPANKDIRYLAFESDVSPEASALAAK